MTSSGKSSIKCADITTEWGMLIEYCVKTKIKLLPASLHKTALTKDETKNGQNIEKTKHNVAGLTINGDLCDYEINCEEKKFSCHKSVLASISNVFKVKLVIELSTWGSEDLGI